MFILSGILIGLVFGSFAGLLYARLPQAYVAELTDVAATHPYPVLRSLCWPASHCAQCQTSLKWWHNIPLLSFVLLRGRCGFCQAQIAWHHLGFECAGAAIFAVIFALAQSTPDFALLPLWALCAWGLFGLGLVTLAALDQQVLLLPDGLTLGLLWLALLLTALGYNPWLMSVFEPHHALTLAIFGAALGYALFWSVGAWFWWWRGVQGLGPGDAKLLAALGAWQGWMALPSILLSACVYGILVALIQRYRQNSQNLQNSSTLQGPRPKDTPATFIQTLRAEVPDQAFAFGPALIAAGLGQAAWPFLQRCWSVV